MYRLLVDGFPVLGNPSSESNTAFTLACFVEVARTCISEGRAVTLRVRSAHTDDITVVIPPTSSLVWIGGPPLDFEAPAVQARIAELDAAIREDGWMGLDLVDDLDPRFGA